MFTVAVIAGSLIFQAELTADQKAAWIKEHATAIQSIDPDDEDDFTDLMPLKQAIGDARLVVLGEQSHGDGAVLLAKARLIKFLNKEMGFDVLAWESGMFDCREVDRALKNPDRAMDEIATLGIFPIWTASSQVRPTLDYVRSTLTSDKPIETCGFDHQFSGGAGRWPQAVIDMFDAADAKLLPDDVRSRLDAGLKPLFERDPQKLDAMLAMWSKIPALMDTNQAALEKAVGVREFEFMRRTAEDAVVSLKSMQEFLASQNNPKATTNNTRDQRMGENLIWLVNDRYKGRKIIAWMATFHGVHDIQQIKSPMNPGMYEGVVNCGTVAHKALGDVMYTIGFTAADGKAGNVWGKTTMELPEPSEYSLEHLCVRTDVPFLFIDFQSLPADHWLRQPVVSRPLGYGEMSAVWPDQLDAMFYIQTMFPSTKANTLPDYAVIRADQK